MGARAGVSPRADDAGHFFIAAGRRLNSFLTSGWSASWLQVLPSNTCLTVASPSTGSRNFRESAHAAARDEVLEPSRDCWLHGAASGDLDVGSQGSPLSNRLKGEEGWEYLHIAIDDCTRLAYAELRTDEKDATCAAFIRRVAAFYSHHGISVQRVEKLKQLRRNNVLGDHS